MLKDLRWLLFIWNSIEKVPPRSYDDRIRPSDSAGFGRIRSDSAGFGRIRSDSVGFGRIQSDLVGFGRIRSELLLGGDLNF